MPSYGWRVGQDALTDSAGEHIAFYEGFFEFGHADAFFVHDVFRRSAGEESREAVVKVDKILSYTPAFGLVGFQDCSIGSAVDYGA